MNERITENIVRDMLRVNGYYKDRTISVEEQKSQNERIQKCLKTASKSGKGIGHPEFIIRSNRENDLVIVIECKADINKHQSESLDSYADFAVDGVLLYSAYLSTEYNVIAIAVSGQSQESLKISSFIRAKGSGHHKVLAGKHQNKLETILPFSQYAQLATSDDEIERMRYSELLNYSRGLHDFIRDYAKLSEAEKPLVVSGTLIALSNKAFSRNYRDYDPAELPGELYAAIKREIEKARIPKAKKENILHSYSFITIHPELPKVNKVSNESSLFGIVSNIEKHVSPFISVYHNFDVVGQFYGEFLRYAGGDASLGIVLTPKHITELFAKLANLTPKSKVLDICAGTGGFLITSMIEMMRLAQNETDRKTILESGLIGVESQPKMFTLAASNMILRGDGKANLYHGSCFDEGIVKSVKAHKANVGMINPPFSQKGDGLHEFNFIHQMLDCLVNGGIGIAVAPISCAIQSHPLRETILKEHTLEAVMSLPDELFYPVGVIPCAMVFRAHIPHNSNPHHRTWFGYWKDDGFFKTKYQGRIDLNNKWHETIDVWLNAYSNRSEIPGFSILRKVGVNDEWCAEAYLETNYSSLTEEDFMREVKKYVLFKIKER